MRDLTELRRAADDHLAFTDHALPDRAEAAARRGAARRRQRRRTTAVAAVASVAAVAAVVAVATPGGGPQPDPAATVVGVVAPSRIEALGYDYRFVRGAEPTGADDAAEIDVPSTPGTYLVTWATSGADQEVTVAGPAGPVRHDAPDFADWAVVEVDQRTGPTRVTASVASGRPGLALYELAADRPAGTTVDGITFRADAGSRLVGARVGEPGESAVEVVGRTRPDERGLLVKTLCVRPDETRPLFLRDPDGTGLDGSTDLYGATRDECGGSVPGVVTSGFDLLGSVGPPEDTGPSRTTPVSVPGDSPVRVGLSAAGDAQGRTAVAADVRLVVTVWATRTDPTVRAGFPRPDQPSYAEADGHLWRLASTGRSMTETLRDRGPTDQGALLVTWFVEPGLNPRGSEVDVVLDPPGPYRSRTDGTSREPVLGAAVVDPGTSVTVTASRGGLVPAPPDQTGDVVHGDGGYGYGIYVRAD